jgi:protein-disulfide isomerase/uncharacterized membrane protein
VIVNYAAVSRTPPGPRGGLSQPASGPFLRLLYTATILALIGVGLAAWLVWVHAQMDHAGAGYTSFCNINESVNCDLVLGSPFARLFGIPVAWFAVAAYTILALLWGAAARMRGDGARLALRLACASTVMAAVFSAYMAFLSFFVLHTVCPMCTGLYLVTLGMLWIALLVPSRATGGGAAGSAPVTRTALAAAAAVALLGVTGLAGATWPRSGPHPGGDLSLDELRKADPEFYDWYAALPVVTSPSDDEHVLGLPDAPITIVEFSDFECAYCARNHTILKQLVERQPELVKVVYRHFPLDATCNEAVESSVHVRACRAAEAAECAGRQGKFHEMADSLFANQVRLFESYLFTLAERLGIDMSEFRRCMSDPAIRDLILADTRAGNALGLTSTPTLYINGRKVVGTLTDVDRYEHAVLIEHRLATEKTEKVAGAGN